MLWTLTRCLGFLILKSPTLFLQLYKNQLISQVLENLPPQIQQHPLLSKHYKQDSASAANIFRIPGRGVLIPARVFLHWLRNLEKTYVSGIALGDVGYNQAVRQNYQALGLRMCFVLG